MFNLQYWTLHLVTKGFRLLGLFFVFFLKISCGLHREPPSLFLMQHWRQIYNYIKCLFSMCVYIVQYYAINLMFNSDGVAALLCGEAKERLLQAPALPLPLSCLKVRHVLLGRAWTWEQLWVIPSLPFSSFPLSLTEQQCLFLMAVTATKASACVQVRGCGSGNPDHLGAQPAVVWPPQHCGTPFSTCQCH